MSPIEICLRLIDLLLRFVSTRHSLYHWPIYFKDKEHLHTDCEILCCVYMTRCHGNYLLSTCNIEYQEKELINISSIIVEAKSVSTRNRLTTFIIMKKLVNLSGVVIFASK